MNPLPTWIAAGAPLLKRNVRGELKRDIEAVRLILKNAFRTALSQLEEEQKMPYFSSIERLGLPAGLCHSREAGWQEGWQQGRQEGFLEALRSMVLETVAIRFGSVPEDLIHTVNSITTRDTLRGLHRQAITVPNLDAFEEALWLAKGGG